MGNRYYIELVGRYYNSQLSKKELIELFDWLNSPEGEAEYDQYLSEKLEAMEGKAYALPDMTADRLLRAIRKKAKIRKSYTSGWTVVRKYAAILIAIFLTGSVMWLMTAERGNGGEKLVFSVAKGNKGTLTLADGSEVWLNAESKIRYADGSHRQITLEGEAYLQVAKDKKHPFVVNTPFADICVFGTTFNVAAYPEDSTVSISLVEGSVGLQLPGQESMTYLTPGQTARFDARSNHLELNDDDLTDVALWREDEITLANAGVRTLCAKMEAWYSLKITLTNQPRKNHLYNMTIRNETIDEILELIHKVTPIRYHITGKEVTIEYIK
ncbi:MAG: FecR domain-containing protein [Tannerella sp.]|jgi:ferric-dicitrate binding protein FerR (iron transport regulator)|nr:FecR domain-containing protein [Tannerella sp.]